MLKGAIIGNKGSHVDDLTECSSYSAVLEKNRIMFTDDALAVDNGIRKVGDFP